jgi:hypothetical protein
MRDFYRTHLIAPFLFLDVSNNITYTVVFTGQFQEERTPGDRFNISLQLQEVA